jgi:hypothetical protein
MSREGSSVKLHLGNALANGLLLDDVRKGFPNSSVTARHTRAPTTSRRVRGCSCLRLWGKAQLQARQRAGVMG